MTDETPEGAPELEVPDPGYDDIVPASVEGEDTTPEEERIECITAFVVVVREDGVARATTSLQPDGSIPDGVSPHAALVDAVSRLTLKRVARLDDFARACHEIEVAVERANVVQATTVGVVNMQMQMSQHIAAQQQEEMLRAQLMAQINGEAGGITGFPQQPPGPPRGRRR